MARAIKARLAEAMELEGKLQQSLRRRIPTAEELFRQEFGLTALGGLLRKTKAFCEFTSRHDWNHQAPERKLRHQHALRLILQHQGSWVRPLSEWTPKGKSGASQLENLLQHLFCKYPVPTFLLRTWSEVGNTQGPIIQTINHPAIARQILISIGQGSSFAKMVALGQYRVDNTVFPPLTKRQCHLFLSQKGSGTFMAALRRTQVLSFGGSTPLAHEITGAFEALENPQTEATTAQTIQWFCNQGMFDLTQVRPMADFIRQSRQANPKWEIFGRTIVTMMEAMAAWHKELAFRKSARGSWPASAIQPYSCNGWDCSELTSAKDLFAEGKAMHHCVGSYVPRAGQGLISIWSLREHGARQLTIEVNHSTKTIVQARGNCNKLAPPLATFHMRQWAAQAGLRISEYL